MSQLLQFTDKGIYCEAGDFYIDPVKPVNRAVITHAHSDHAYRGHQLYLSHRQSVPVMRQRLGAGIQVQSLEYNEQVVHKGVRISLHPAGHIIGSSQVRVEWKGEVWVASGDYKTVDDGISTPFEPVKCNTFITESTFGLPVYRWKSQEIIFSEMENWWKRNRQEGIASIVFCYALGKAQRILCGIDKSVGPIYAHGAIENVNEILRNAGESIPAVSLVTAGNKKEGFRQALILATASVQNTSWLSKMSPYSIGVASGWMQVRGNKRRSAADVGFALSDHADWTGLNDAVKATGAARVLVTHGFTYQLAKWLREQGLDAQEVSTSYHERSQDDAEADV